ncbi:MAG: ferrous iron transport protein B [Endomicrobium sp.]|nr:ferrous iron transport protein B [Endomicrobium sp.]
MSILERDIIVALVGNPNSGKSTIFNSLTEANQSVGNYPGVTVEKKEGLKNHRGYSINFIDLPGTYSLSAYSDDEIVARDFLINGKPDIVINVIDASNIERNLYLFTQIAELNVPIMIVLNMIDILKLQGKTIDKETMSNLLGVPIFAASANKGIGITSLLDYIVNVLEEGKLKKQMIAKVDYGENIKEEIDKLEKLILKDSQLSKFPKSWLSIKLLDNDPLALKLVCEAKKKSVILSQLERSRSHIKEHFGKEAEIEIADKRYGFANSVIKTVVKKTGKKKADISEIIDNFVLNRYLGIPIFVLIMYIIFKFAFVFSEPVINVFEMFFEWLGNIVGSIISEESTRSLVVDGMIGGVGGILGLFPLILFMFFAIAFFEDSGYMARAAFVMDKVMNRFGLHGKSFLPLMISINGCAVPGILATRTLDSKRDRLITMFVVPFMVCGAKIPVFALITGAFFSSKNQASIMSFVYVLSVIIAFVTAKLLSTTLLKGEPAHFVMELPPYHMPQIKGLLLKMWERSWLYLRKAGTVVMLISVLIWTVFTYPKAPVSKNLTKNEKAMLQLKYSLAGRAGEILEPLFKPIGMDANRVVALVAGLAAKEVIVSTLGTIYSIEKSDSCNSKSLREKIACDKSWSPLKGLVFLIFCLIYTPCTACLTVFFKESSSSYKWLSLIVVGNAVFAWIASFIVFQVGMLLEIGV